MTSELAGSRFKYPLVVLVLVLAYLSFAGNLLRAIPEMVFEQPVSVSEKLIVDGIDHAQRTGDRRYPLGNLVVSAGKSEFRPYLSQYGLQAVVWRSLHSDAGWSYPALHRLNAGLLALTIAGLFLAVTREFGWRSGLAATLPFTVAPWFVLYARDLYWVGWTWLLPLVIAFAAGRWMFRAGRWPWLFALLFGAAMFVKMACGYEYVSAIALAGAAPVAYFGLRDGFGPRTVLARLIGLVVATLIAGALAMGLHMSRFESTADASHRMSNLVSKRLYGADPQQVAEEACQSEVWTGPDCVPTYVESLRASPLTVVARYVVARDVLPWFGLATSSRDSADFKQLAASLLKAPSIAGLKSLADSMTISDLAKLANSAATALLLLGLLVMAARRLLRVPAPRRGALAALLLLSLLAPLSWFVLAKGHSYIHVILNMALWYVSFIPAALILAFDRAPD